MKKLVFAVVATTALSSVKAVDFPDGYVEQRVAVIEAGTSTNFTEKTTFDKLRVEGSATVDKVNVTATNIVMAGGSVLAKGSGAQFGTTNAKDSAKDCVFTNYISGAFGKISAESSATAWLGYVKLGADPEIVQASGDYLDFLSLSNATLKTRRLYNYSSFTGRVTVAGSSTIAHPADGYDNNGLFQSGAFEVALRDRASLTIDFANQKAMVSASAASLRFTGSGDIKVFSGSDKNGDVGSYYVDIYPKTVFDNEGAVTFSSISYEFARYHFPNSYAFGPNVTQLNLTGYYSHLRSIMVVDAAATVTLPPKTVCQYAYFRGEGTIRLDATTQDVSLTGPVQNGSQLTLEKIGEHEATVVSTNLANVIVRAGALRLTKDCVFEGSLKTFGTGKVVVDGCTLYLTESFAVEGKIETVNGGRVVKKGEGTFTAYSGSDGHIGLPSALHVQEGAFNFSAAGCPAKRWRLTIKGTKNAATAAQWFSLNRIWLFDADGDRVGGDMQYLAQGSAMKKGYVQFVASETLVHDGTDKWNDLPRLSWLFGQGQEIKDKNNYPRLKGLSKAIALDDATSWVSIEWWLNDSANPVASYNLGYYASGRYPTDWDLSVYDEEKAEWVPVDTRRGFAPPKDQGENWMNGVTMGTYVANGKAPPAEYFRLNAYVRKGLVAADAPTAVRVDSGASLDLSSFTDGTAVIEEIAISTVGGGVLAGGALAAAGVLSVQEPVTGSVAIPLDLEGMTGLENLANWKVSSCGAELVGVHPTYDAENKKVCFAVSYRHFTESVTGDLFAGLEGDMWVVEFDPNVSCTNTVALSGSMRIFKSGTGTLVCAESSSDFTGDIVVAQGLLEGPVSNAFGMGTVMVEGSKTSTSQVRIGSTETDTSYDNDFVFEGDSSDSYPALYFVTSTQRKTTVNGSVTASGYLAMTDSGSGDSQNYGLVSFNGPVTAVGQIVSYPTDNQMQFVGTVTAACVRAETSYPRMGRLTFKSGANEIGEIKIDYDNCSASVSGSLGGAALHLTGSNTETGRGSFSVNGDQTVAWLMQDSRTTFKNYTLSSSSGTLTLTGGTSVARCQVQLNDGSKSKLSVVVNAGNDDFVQIFSNTTWTASGDLVVSNGTLRLAGTATAAKMRSLTVAGGAFELESTAANALESVPSIAVGAGARLRLASVFETTFAPKTALRMEGTETDLPTIELPEGVSATMHSAWLGAKRLDAGTYTGEGGPATAKVVPWISGAGTLTVRTGCGLMLLIR